MERKGDQVRDMVLCTVVIRNIGDTTPKYTPTKEAFCQGEGGSVRSTIL